MNTEQEPQAQAGEPKTLEWMEQPRHIADAATIRLLTEAIAKKDAALKACVEALETCNPGEYSTGHVIDPSFDEKLVDAAIAQAKEAHG